MASAKSGIPEGILVRQPLADYSANTDREVIFELIRREWELRDELDDDERKWIEFGHALETVIDRLDPGAVDAYYEGRKDYRDAS